MPEILFIDNKPTISQLDAICEFINGKSKIDYIVCRRCFILEYLGNKINIPIKFWEDFLKRDALCEGQNISRKYFNKLFKSLKTGKKYTPKNLNLKILKLISCVNFKIHANYFKIFHEIKYIEKFIKENNISKIYYVGNYDNYACFKLFNNCTAIVPFFNLQFKVEIAKNIFKKLFKLLKVIFTNYKTASLRSVKRKAKGTNSADIVFIAPNKDYLHLACPLILSVKNSILSYKVVIIDNNTIDYANQNNLNYVSMYDYYAVKFLFITVLDLIKISPFIIIDLLIYIIRDQVNAPKLYIYLNTIYEILFSGTISVEYELISQNLCSKLGAKYVVILEDHLPYARGIINGAKLNQSKTIVCRPWGPNGYESYYPSTTDMIFSSGPRDTLAMLKCGYNKRSVINVKKTSTQESDYKFNNNYIFTKSLNKNLNYILFTTQPYSENVYDTDRYRAIDIVYKTFSQLKDYELIVKLHPREYNSSEYDLMAKKYKYRPIVISNEEETIESLIKISKAVIVINSSSAFKAILNQKIIFQYRYPNARYAPALNLFEYEASITFSSSRELLEKLGKLNQPNEITKIKLNMAKFVDNWLKHDKETMTEIEYIVNNVKSYRN